MRCSGERGGPRVSTCRAGRSVLNQESVRCYLCRLAMRQPISSGPLLGGPDEYAPDYADTADEELSNCGGPLGESEADGLNVKEDSRDGLILCL